MSRWYVLVSHLLWFQYPSSDQLITAQLFFDDEHRNFEVESLGVTMQLVPSRGTDRRLWEQGLAMWRKRRGVRVKDDAGERTSMYLPAGLMRCCWKPERDGTVLHRRSGMMEECPQENHTPINPQRLSSEHRDLNTCFLFPNQFSPSDFLLRSTSSSEP